MEDFNAEPISLMESNISSFLVSALEVFVYLGIHPFPVYFKICSIKCFKVITLYLSIHRKCGGLSLFILLFKICAFFLFLSTLSRCSWSSQDSSF